MDTLSETYNKINKMRNICGYVNHMNFISKILLLINLDNFLIYSISKIFLIYIL